MYKRSLSLLALFVCAALLLSACGSKEEAEPVDIVMGDGAGGDAPAGMPSGGMPSGDMPAGMPSGGGSGNSGSGGGSGKTGARSGGTGSDQPVSGEADVVYGRVDSIVGNEATLTEGSYQDRSFTASDKTGVYLLPVGMAIGTGDFTGVSSGMVLRLSFDGAGAIIAVSILSR